MRLTHVLMGAAAVILLVIIISALLYFPLNSNTQEQNVTTPQVFRIIEMGRAGEYGYVVYEGAKLNSNLTLVAYRMRGFKEVTVINDNEGIEAERIPELAATLKPLEKYGYTLKTSESRTIGRGTYIVATGGMPNYVLDDIMNNVSSGVVVYIGKKNLVLRSGAMVNENWYENLTAEQKDRIYIYEKTLGEYLDSLKKGNEADIVSQVLTNGWSRDTAVSYNVLTSSRTTSRIMMKQSQYMRIIYNDGSSISITDSVELAAPQGNLQPQPSAIYPWQTAMLQQDINKTAGNVYFHVHLNSAEVATERLKKVVDENVFVKRLSFNEPGDYILTIKDSSGTIASGVLHVWDFKISYVGESYSRHVFNVTADSVPLKSGEAVVSVNNGAEKKEVYISNGEMVIPAMLSKGDNVFNIEFEGTTINVPVKYENESVWDIYIKYGVPGFILIVLVYLFARLSKRPVYTIRVSEGSKEIRREVKISKADVLEAVRRMREDTKLKKYPISFAEFEMALKRYVTEGADITEGNVDEIIRRMVRDKELEQYDRYYQLPGEENLKDRAILRMIREKLIENGVQFKEADKKFVTKDFEIGLYSASYEKKAVIVAESSDEIERIIESLSEAERAQMKIKQRNGLITFITFRKINEVF